MTIKVGDNVRVKEDKVTQGIFTGATGVVKDIIVDCPTHPVSVDLTVDGELVTDVPMDFDELEVI